MEHNRGVTTLHPWGRGMCNKVPNHVLPDGAVANAVNVDFGAGNRISSRRGRSTKIYDGLGMKDVFDCPAGVFFIEGLNLKQLNTDNTATTLLAGITGTEYAWDYLPANDTVYFSDGVISRKIVSGTLKLWGLPRPSQPLVYGTAGSYGGGTYLAAVCWVDADGVESGASLLANVTVADSAGIVFASLPSAPSTEISYLRLYLSMPNGSELYHVADLTPGTSTYTITSGRYDNSNVLTNRFVSPAPAGRIIRHYNGRILVADEDGYVWHSDPLEFDHFRLSSNFLMFPDQLDLMEPVKGGIFVAHGDKTEFYAGDFDEGFDIREVFPDHGAVYGTGRRMPNSDNVCWQAQHGTIIGNPDGSFKNITEELLAPGTADSGTAVIREEDGLRQFVVKLDNPTTSRLAARSFIEAEVIRKGA